MNFIPNTKEDKELMLKEIGISNVDELFRDIPEELILKDQLKIPKPMSELELKKHLENIAGKNKLQKNFIGAGAYNHFIPSVVPHIISRSEFYTAYTPYQPEISQGILQAIYEYQTMICELTGMDMTNASMYDGASALAETCIMAANITRRNQILLSKTIHPEYIETVKTYAHFHNIELIEVDFENGTTDINKIKELISDKTAAIFIQNPNFFGCIEDLKTISNLAHEKKALLVTCVTEPASLALIKSPGELGADIVAGEGQSFGNPLNFGGPYLGIIAAKKEYMRYVPGRLVGLTKDTNGKEGFVLTLQAREQHIRREKASSNICSNQALCALAATVHLATLGKQGLKQVSELCLQKSHYLHNQLKENGCQTPFTQPFFNEFVIRLDNFEKTIGELERNNISVLKLEKFYPELKDSILICTTELNSREDIDELIEVIKKCN
ncbi:MAG: aminomethyl-transferring glycine dehydrogenase subunit GcvPA [Candidatus Woesearchaeota archaeon]|jgi:glycine dehydrogenase subunit 1|nr:aminomethyl-transferring glycine dehydrogenase subunit GcvPA [Candidatus Woesearchaeota archaeon]